MVIEHAEGGPEVRGDAVEVEVGGLHRRVGEAANLPGQKLGEGKFVDIRIRRNGVDQFARPVVGRNHVATNRLRQGLDVGGHELLANALDEPVKAHRADGGKQRQRNVDRHTVVFGSRLKTIGYGELLIALHPGRRERRLHGSCLCILGFDLDQIFFDHGQEVRGFGPGFAPPGFERLGRRNIRRNSSAKEVDDRLVIEEDIATPRAFLDLGQFLAERTIGTIESGEAAVDAP